MFIVLQELTFSFGIFLDCGLRVVGSSVNGLGTNSSDADMCLILSTREVLNSVLYIRFYSKWCTQHAMSLDHFLLQIDQQTEAMDLLRYAQLMLSQSCKYFSVSRDILS